MPICLRSVNEDFSQCPQKGHITEVDNLFVGRFTWFKPTLATYLREVSPATTPWYIIFEKYILIIVG